MITAQQGCLRFKKKIRRKKKKIMMMIGFKGAAVSFILKLNEIR